MNIGDKGIALIKGFEGFKAKAYLDGGGVPTIGFGTTKGVKMGQIITESQAETFLRRDISLAVTAVSNAVTVALSQDQFDSLVCFTYNVGIGAFKGSTLLKLLNSGHYDQVPAQLLRWDKDNGVVVAGLLRRRQAEGVLFSTGVVEI